MTAEGRVPGSFRDPSGFLFVHDGSLFRQIHTTYEKTYTLLMQSGLYQQLVGAGLLIRHDEVDTNLAMTAAAVRVIKPERVPFISYPYEWCFSQLKDAALTTLAIQQQALAHGMTLKDSSAYNIQFLKGKPILVDSLSFEAYQEGMPWVAYRQFCQHFLAPLALMSYTDVRLSQLLRVYIDGIPLDLASSLLPLRTRFRFALLAHIHLHARGQRRFASATQASRARKVSRRSLLALIENLEGAIRRLQWDPQRTAWANYYQDDSYDETAMAHKKALVREFAQQANPQSIWDLGANTGLFSRIAGGTDKLTVAWDIDPGAVELNYREVVSSGESNMLPLMLDLSNPSPGTGWANQERQSLVERRPADLVLALALVHHLAIANNVPLETIAQFMSQLGQWLLIEFVPKTDPKAGLLLAAREDIFPAYTRQGFEQAFTRHYNIVRSEPIDSSQRHLYLMSGK